MVPLIQVLAVISGILLILLALHSAVTTVVLPRSARVWLTSIVFGFVRVLLSPWTRSARSYESRDRVMAFYAPLSLLMLPVMWLLCVMTGYTAIFWALGIGSLLDAFRLSGSSLLTLGFATADTGVLLALVFSEATLGLGLVALLIAYLPTMYTAFAQREQAVSLLEVRAGAPPSAVEMLSRAHRLRTLDSLSAEWDRWETWFTELEESHTTLSALVFFRSPQSGRSWVTASGAVLDAASLLAATVEVPRDVQAELCIRAGYLALRAIADFFGIDYTADPRPDEPISISREEFDAACAELAKQGVPLKADREQAWRDFRGWRVNYDTVLLALAGLTMAPYAAWSSDRSLRRSPGRISR